MNLTEKINKIFPVLELILSQEKLSDLKNTDKKNLDLYHFGLGLWIRNNLLSENGALYQSFIDNNIIHKDDMSSIIITSFYEYLARKI